MPGFDVPAATIDHGIPALALALEKRARIEIWCKEVVEQGLGVGPRLRGFEDAVLRRMPDEPPIPVPSRSPRPDGPATLPRGLLRNEMMRTATGRKHRYVVECCFTRANIKKPLGSRRGRTPSSSKRCFESPTRRSARRATAAKRGRSDSSRGSLARKGS